MSAIGPFRILHADGDSFFASCEIALDPALAGRPVWVGGGRRGDGIVIAGNRIAKQFGIKTGMACFEARQLCPQGVLCRPHYEDYRRLSQAMFRILELYTPTLVPTSIDEGFLDFTGMEHHVWRHTTPAECVQGIRERIRAEVGIPMSAGLASCSQLAKLATDAGKPGFLEIPAGQERDFLATRPLRELSGIGERLERSLAALGARTFGDVAKLPSGLLRQKLGIRGQQLWLLANGLWHEPLLLAVKGRTTISSNTTLPYDEPDYEAALTFTLTDLQRRPRQQLPRLARTRAFKRAGFQVGGRRCVIPSQGDPAPIALAGTSAGATQRMKSRLAKRCSARPPEVAWGWGWFL